MKVSTKYNKQVVSSVFSIIVLLLCLLLLMSLTVVLAYCTLMIGLVIAEEADLFLLSILGAAFASIGAFVLAFTFKFLFRSNTAKNKGLVEVKREDEPTLFLLLDELALATKSYLPKKVYLSADVNSFVFYEHSLLSVFMPVRKNLVIGLGLMNTLTQSEFEATLAHEFAHLNQSSMKIGAMVQNLNSWMNKLLFDQDGLNRMYEKWFGKNMIKKWFGQIALKYINLIRTILKKVYQLVNLEHLALKRQMELQADEVAVKLYGSMVFISALLKVELSNIAFLQAVRFNDYLKSINKMPDDFYQLHSLAMKNLLKENAIQLEDGHPFMSKSDLIRLTQSKVKIFDQWDSHPELFTRIESIESHHVILPGNKTGHAFLYLQGRKAFHAVLNSDGVVQNAMNGHIKSSWTELDKHELENEFNLFLNSRRIHSVYKGYFDSRSIDPSWLKEELNTLPHPIEAFEFNEELILKTKLLNGLYVDERLLMLKLDDDEEQLPIDFDGKMIAHDEVEQLLENVTEEIKRLEFELMEKDKQFISFLKFKTKKLGIQQQYDDAVNEFLDSNQNISHATLFLSKIELSIYQHKYVKDFKSVLTPAQKISNFEVTLRRYIKTFMKDKDVLKFHGELNLKQLRSYLDVTFEYLNDSGVNALQLMEIEMAVFNFRQILNVKSFAIKKQFLDKMAEIMVLE